MADSVARHGRLRGRLRFAVRVRRLVPDQIYDVTVRGIPIGELETNYHGAGRARCRSLPRRVTDQPLGVDPRGEHVAIDDGVAVGNGSHAPDPCTPSRPSFGEIRCCMPPERMVRLPTCAHVTAEECGAAFVVGPATAVAAVRAMGNAGRACRTIRSP